jgi:hypothetical protein
VLGAAALAGPAAAQAPVLGDSPRAGMSIIAFPERDMVEVGGYRNGQEVTVDVIRSGQKIGTTTAKAEGDLPETDALEGAIEVNHPGGACWATTDADGNAILKPDIKAGDRIVATSEGTSDASTVAYVRADDYARYVKDGDTPRRDAEGRYLIHMEGSAMKPDGPYGPEVLEARLVNPERFSTGKRTVRAASVGSEGTLDYDTGTGRWTAEWWLTEADAAKAVDAEPRIMWLGADPAAETELTIFEFGVGDEGCGAGGAEPDPFPLGEIPPLAPVGVSEAPQNDRVIEVFPSRDFVALAGFKAGETAKVEVWRQVKDPDTGTVAPELIGRAEGLTPDARGEIEINHPGGACWESSAQLPVFPDLRPRDQVRVTAYGPDGTELDVNQTTIADVNIREKTVVNDGNDIIVEGNVHLPNGDPWPATRADELEVRLRSKAFTAPGVNNNKQDLRASVDTAPTDTLTVTGDGTFTAVFHDRSKVVQDIALDPATEQRIMWLGADPAAGSEGTFFERGSEVVGGPECDPPAAPGSPVRDTPIITPPDPDAPPAQVVGPQADGSILVPGIGGLTTLRDADGRRVLAAQVDAQSLAKLAETGVVSVVLEQKARPNGVLYRFKIRKAGGGTGRAALVAAGAKPRGKAIATFWRAAPKKAGKYRFKLKSRALRGLKPGRYVIDVTAANAKKKVSGKTVSVSFRVR